MTSAYEYLEVRFDARVRMLGSVLFLLLRLGWMSMVMYVGSFALTQMTASLVAPDKVDRIATALFGASGAEIMLRDSLLYWIVFAIGITATVYTCVGGFRAAIWNDVLQSLMLFGGAVVTLTYVVWTTGTGPSDWWQTASAHTAGHTSPIIFSFDPTVRMTLFTAGCLHFFWTICTHGSDQVVLQRYFSTRSISAARWSYLVNALTDLTIGVMLALCGLALLALYLDNPTYLPAGILTPENGHIKVTAGDKVLPHFFAHQLPAGIGGVILAVLVCDAMQTLVSGVNSIAAVFTSDVLDHLAKPGQTKHSALNLARVITVIVGLTTTAIALGVAYFAQHSDKNIIDLMAPAFNMFLGPLASLFFIGMFLRCGSKTVLTAAGGGLVISFLWSYWQLLFKTDYQLTITLTTAVPYLSSFLIAFLLERLYGDPADDPRYAYTWREIMRRPIETTEISPDDKTAT